VGDNVRAGHSKVRLTDLERKAQTRNDGHGGTTMGIVERCFIASAVMGLLLLIGIGFLPL
jgi:hypothetical protein